MYAWIWRHIFRREHIKRTALRLQGHSCKTCTLYRSYESFHDPNKMVVSYCRLRMMTRFIRSDDVEPTFICSKHIPLDHHP